MQASDGNNINRLDVTVTVTNVEEAGTVELSSVQPQIDTPLAATLDDPDEVESTITWSWQRSRAGSKSSWSTISGATSDSYTPAAADVGRYLRATARYDDGYSNGKTSAGCIGKHRAGSPCGQRSAKVPDHSSATDARSKRTRPPVQTSATR